MLNIDSQVVTTGNTKCEVSVIKFNHLSTMESDVVLILIEAMLDNGYKLALKQQVDELTVCVLQRTRGANS